MVRQKVIKGDTVEVPTVYPGEVGWASHEDVMSQRGRGRWVVWRFRGGHWAAGFYESNLIDFVGLPDPVQPRLKL